MIDLNLLSPERQKALYARIFFAMIERVMITIVILVLMTTVLLLGIETRLTENLSSIEARQVLSTEYVSVNEEIRRLNAAIDTVESAQLQMVPMTVLIDDIVRRTPDGVLIGTLSFETATDAVRIVGFAEQREQLLDYEAALTDSPYLTRLESPISNLFQRTDLEFRFEALLDKEQLKTVIDPQNDAEEN